MKQIVTGGQMKLLDEYTIHEIGIPSLVLMERAALSVFQALREENFPLKRVLVLCGTGNNGADGVAVARMLHMTGVSADICILGKKDHYTEEMRKQVKIAENYHISFVKNAVPAEYTTIVDAVFGVGLSREVGGKYRDTIEALNRSGAKVMAVDIPSGISADTGKVLGCAVKADVTVTFAYEKAGLLFYPGASCAGKVRTADIGIYRLPQNDFELSIQSCEERDLCRIPARKPDGNKGTFGKIFLAAGSRDISGAAYLSACAALRAGAGMIKVHTREENRQALTTMLPEAMYSFYDDEEIRKEQIREGLAWADVIGVGPGLGTGQQAEDILYTILAEGRKPLLIDADGLNLLAGRMEVLSQYPAPVLVTPHLGEFSRISGVSVEEWKEAPLYLTKRFAGKYHLTVVCKDSRTVISDGGEEIFINTSGNSGMATAGSGDVLFGILMGFLSQGLSAREAAALGVYFHGMAGDMAAAQKGEYSMIAGDIITQTAEILKKRGAVL